MNREDLWGILGSLLLFGMAVYDAEWRWFWAIMGMLILVWSLYTAIFNPKA